MIDLHPPALVSPIRIEHHRHRSFRARALIIDEDTVIWLDGKWVEYKDLPPPEKREVVEVLFVRGRVDFIHFRSKP